MAILLGVAFVLLLIKTLWPTASDALFKEAVAWLKTTREMYVERRRFALEQRRVPAEQQLSLPIPEK